MSDGEFMKGPPPLLAVGQKVKTRSDCGNFKGLVVCAVHNDWYCTAKDRFFRKRHFNMWFLEPTKKDTP